MIPATFASLTANSGVPVVLPQPGAPAAAPQGSDPSAFGRELQRAVERSPDEADAPKAQANPAPKSESPRPQTPAERARGERKPASSSDARGGRDSTGSDIPTDRTSGSSGTNGRDTATDEAAGEPSADDTGAAAATGDLSAIVASLAVHSPALEARVAAAAPHRTSRQTPDAADDAAGRHADGAASLPPSAAADVADTSRATAKERWHTAQAAHGELARLQAGAGAESADPGSSFKAQLADAASHGQARAAAEGLSIDAASALAPSAGNGRAEPSAPGSTTEVAEDSLAPPVGSRDFAQALGARVAVFARDGVEHARLNLNPADMGPIALQLSMEGNQVRVDMTADMAATRQALEHALPSLASALSEAGLTLSGGGVSQQTHGDAGEPRGKGQAPSGRQRGSADAEPDTTEPMIRTRAARLDGLVDLYA